LLHRLASYVLLLPLLPIGCECGVHQPHWRAAVNTVCLHHSRLHCQLLSSNNNCSAAAVTSKPLHLRLQDVEVRPHRTVDSSPYVQFGSRRHTQCLAHRPELHKLPSVCRICSCDACLPALCWLAAVQLCESRSMNLQGAVTCRAVQVTCKSLALGQTGLTAVSPIREGPYFPPYPARVAWQARKPANPSRPLPAVRGLPGLLPARP
jgi:hypothetical protein